MEYLLWRVLKAVMPDGKGCYTPIGDTGIHLKRYWDDGSWLRVHGSWLRGNVVMNVISHECH